MIHLVSMFLACPQCTFNQFMPSWYFFVILRLFVVALICRGRLDIVRVLGLLAAFEVPFFFTWKTGVIWMYAERPGTQQEQIAGIFEMLFSTGVLYALILIAVSRIQYFKVSEVPRVRVLRVLVVIPAFIAVTYLHRAYAYY